jgi:phage shock protein C
MGTWVLRSDETSGLCLRNEKGKRRNSKLLSWEEYVMEQQGLRRQNSIIAGVCGGLGAFFGINPWVFRFIFILLALPGGLPGILMYLAMWIIIPARRW